MNAIVVRNADGSIRHMGPDDGNYSPGVPAGCTRTIEPDYETLIRQHLTELTARPKLPTLEERVAVLEAKTGA